MKDLARQASGPLYAVRALLFAASVPLLLRFVSLPRLGDWLEPESPGEPGTRPESRFEAAEARVRRVDALLRRGRPLVRSGCLVRGLTHYRLLREAGFDVSLVFGMGRVDGEEDFTGHCWIEMDGRALVEKRDPKLYYTETWRIAPRNRAAAGHPAAARA